MIYLAEHGIQWDYTHKRPLTPYTQTDSNIFWVNVRE